MRSLVASVLLGLGALGFVAMAPASAQAAPPCGPKAVCTTSRVAVSPVSRVSYRGRTNRVRSHRAYRGRNFHRGHVRHNHRGWSHRR